MAEPYIAREIRQRGLEALRAGDQVTRLRCGSVLTALQGYEKSKQFRGWTLEKEQEVIAKYVGGLRKALEAMPPDMRKVHPYNDEIETLTEFLPEKLDEAATTKMGEALVQNGRIGMGEFMRRMMKESDAGRQGLLDPKVVSQVGRNLGCR